ncbi:MFS transporter [Candidatus Pelagibacter sp.]|jgi:predicted MFS family arabinose efflux permease|nr:MFS transporter [Candidatus Pelagibacter sp.]
MFKNLSLKVILFGFIFTFFSSFGQSYFIGIFNASIRADLSITHGQFGTIYASATLLSSLILIWIGKKIDDMDAFKFSIFVIILLSLACYFFSTIKIVPLLFFGIFLLRLSGQGLMSHTATTTVSRYFEKTRGKALSVTWLGLSAAEFILPVLMVFLLTFISWRNIWISISLLVLVLLPISSFFLIKKLKLESRENFLEDKKFESITIKQWTRSEVLKDYRFYIISLNMLSMPSIATGVFVYQSFILSSKNWGPFVMAQSFMAYSVLSVLTLSLSGFLIDKYTSRKLLIYMNIPLFISTLVLYSFDSSYSSFIFLGLIGITNGFANVLGSSTWAEIYGVKYIGGIKALTSGLMVFATAAGTAIFGILIDTGFTINSIAVFSAVYIAIIVLLLFIFRKKIVPTYI